MVIEPKVTIIRILNQTPLSPQIPRLLGLPGANFRRLTLVVVCRCRTCNACFPLGHTYQEWEDQSSVPRDEFDFPLECDTKDLPSRSMRDCACDWLFYYLINNDQPNYLLYMVICVALTTVLEPCQLSEFCTRYILEGSTPLFTTYLSSSPTKFGSELYTCHQPIINLRLTLVNHSGKGPVG